MCTWTSARTALFLHTSRSNRKIWEVIHAYYPRIPLVEGGLWAGITQVIPALIPKPLASCALRV